MRGSAVLNTVLFLTLSVDALAEKTDLKLTGSQGVHHFFTLSEPWASDQAYIEKVAEGICSNKPICFAHFWVAGTAAPRGFPLSDAEVGREIAAFNHNKHTGARRMLWKCSKFPRESTKTCFS